MAFLKGTANPSEVLAEATTRAAQVLELSEQQLAIILGVDAGVTGVAIEPVSSSGRRAQQLIRIYQQLCAITGTDTVAMSHWMTTRNRRFDCSPRERIQTVDGLDEVESYLDSLT